VTSNRIGSTALLGSVFILLFSQCAENIAH
jgi:hypothetical protein